MKRPPWVDLAILLGGLAVAAALVWFVLVRPGQAQRAAAEAKGAATVAEGELKKAADALPIIEKHFTERERIERVTVQGNAGIMAAPGAAERVGGDVDRAARAALCLQPIYRDHPACQQLPDADSAGDEATDTARPAAGG